MSEQSSQIKATPTRRATLLSAVSAGLLFLCSCATERSVDRKLPPEANLNRDAGRGGLLFAAVKLEGSQELPFIVDTGSPGTLFDKSLISRLGARLPLGTWTVPIADEQQKSGVYWEPKLYLGETRLKTGRLCAAIDFRRLSKQVGHPIMGILTMDCLKHYCLQLDFQAGKMRFLDSKQLDPAQLGKPIPLKFSFYSRLFTDHAGFAGGKSARVLIDTGFNGDGQVKKGSITGHDSGGARLARCYWEEETYTNLNVEIGGNVIGLGFLARHLVTFDFPNRIMYLKQTSVGPLVDEEFLAAFEFLKSGMQAGLTPGWLTTDHGTISLESHTDLETFGFAARKPGDSSVFHFTVTKKSEDSPWKLQRAWRTDQDNKTLEDFSVP